MPVRAIPVTFRGMEFRSTLEADWQKTFDSWRIVTSYEPEGLTLPDGEHYRPDFWLPALTTWVEVKGIGVPRRWKPGLLAAACLHAPGCDQHQPVSVLKTGLPRNCPCGFGPDFPWQLVVVCRPNVSGKAAWEAGDLALEQRIVLLECPVCGQRGFADANGLLLCRRCWQPAAGGNAWPSGMLPFDRIEPPRGPTRRKKPHPR